MKAITTVGGVDMGKDLRALNKPHEIVIATPGRFLAHLEDTPGMDKRVQGVKFLVLDEADRLLDMGFSRDIRKITSYLPSKARQTFLFSATFSKEIKKVANSYLRQDYSVVDVIGEEVGQTHSHVPQSAISAPIGKNAFSFSFTLLIC